MARTSNPAKSVANMAADSSTVSKNAAATKKSTAKKSAAKKTAANKSAASKKSPTKKTAAKKRAAAKSGAKSATTTASKKTIKKAAVQNVTLPAFLTDKKWLKQQRESLLSERETYIHNAAALVAEAQALMDDRDPGDVQFDEESGEGDTLAVERDRDLALSAKAREKVDEIDAALIRLDKGKYGICVSGDDNDVIPQERLEALPMAAKCVQHQTAMF